MSALGTVPPAVVVWPALAGAGLYLLLTAQPIGKPLPPLAERLARLDVERRLRARAGDGVRSRLFASSRLGAVLLPLVEELGRSAARLGVRFGLVGAELQRQLELVRPGVSVSQYLGEKMCAGVVGCALFPAMTLAGIHPFGPWPLWAWLAGFAAGFLAPDWQRERRVASVRTRFLLELPAVLDLLTIACAAGLALEQAMLLVADEGRGLVAGELRRVYRASSLGQATLIEALEWSARHANIPELASVVGHLRSAHEQGLPLVAALSAQADALRERKRLRLLEDGNRATVRMVLPVAVFILPVLFVVLLVPAAVTVLHLGG